MMTREDRQEALSLAYVHAVAAACGMTYSVPSKDYGIDLTLHEIEDRPGGQVFQSGTNLEVQAKATTAVAVSRGVIRFDLPVKNYNDLRYESDVDRILTVLVLPVDEAGWVRHSRTKLELRGRMYWQSLRGWPAVANRFSVRVSIPRRQVFTPATVSARIRELKRRRSQR